MDSNKHYLDELGLIRVLDSISQAIRNKTSDSLNVIDVENPETGEIELKVENPQNFVTAQAIYLAICDNNHSEKLIINQQSSRIDGENNYIVEDNEIEYDRKKSVKINLKLIKANEITNLFNN